MPENIFQAIVDLLDAFIPSGALNSTSWYTLNECIAYIFVIKLLWNWFLEPISTMFSFGKKRV